MVEVTGVISKTLGLHHFQFHVFYTGSVYSSNIPYTKADGDEKETDLRTTT